MMGDGRFIRKRKADPYVNMSDGQRAFAAVWAGVTGLVDRDPKRKEKAFAELEAKSGLSRNGCLEMMRHAGVQRLCQEMKDQKIANLRVSCRELGELAKTVLRDTMLASDATHSAKNAAAKASLDFIVKSGFAGLLSDDHSTQTDSTEAVALRVVGGTDHADRPTD